METTNTDGELHYVHIEHEVFIVVYRHEFYGEDIFRTYSNKKAAEEFIDYWVAEKNHSLPKEDRWHPHKRVNVFEQDHSHTDGYDWIMIKKDIVHNEFHLDHIDREKD